MLILALVSAGCVSPVGGFTCPESLPGPPGDEIPREVTVFTVNDETRRVVFCVRVGDAEQVRLEVAGERSRTPNLGPTADLTVTNATVEVIEARTGQKAFGTFSLAEENYLIVRARAGDISLAWRHARPVFD